MNIENLVKNGSKKTLVYSIVSFLSLNFFSNMVAHEMLITGHFKQEIEILLTKNYKEDMGFLGDVYVIATAPGRKFAYSMYEFTHKKL